MAKIYFKIYRQNLISADGDQC